MYSDYDEHTRHNDEHTREQVIIIMVVTMITVMMMVMISQRIGECNDGRDYDYNDDGDYDEHTREQVIIMNMISQRTGENNALMRWRMRYFTKIVSKGFFFKFISPHQAKRPEDIVNHCLSAREYRVGVDMVSLVTLVSIW